MKPESITEWLMFNTVMVRTPELNGTGFFFNFQIDGRSIPAIITNKHVVSHDKDTDIKFTMHLKTGELESDRCVDVEAKDEWIFHPDPNIDLCCNLVQPDYSRITRRTGKKPFYWALTEEHIATEKICLDELSAVEEVVMVGCPRGMWEYHHGFPIFRHGYTAFHPGLDFNDRSIGLLDIAAFPGSSGSPVLIVNERNYNDKHGNVHPGPRVLLLGIVYASALRDADNKESFIDLGYYVKAHELYAFHDLIRKRLPGLFGKQERQ